MRMLHEVVGWVSVAVCALVGGLSLWLDRRQVPLGRTFWVTVGAALTVVGVQVGIGVYLVASGYAGAGDQHIFYGFLVAFVLAFAYIYRAQLGARPAFRYGLLLLFLMGLSLRGIATFGVGF